jgi:hypothetical protein
MSDDTAQTGDTAQTTVSEPANVPSEAPEASKNEVVTAPVKDDNLAQNVPDGQIPVSPETAQTGPNEVISPPAPEQAQAPETPTTPPETGTAQTVVNEPLGSESEPKVSEPAPTSVSEPTTIFSPIPTPAEPVSPKPSLARQLIAKAREAIQNRKRKKIDHVMDLFAKRTNITNNQVADFLHVSDATATRYLQVLENENKIRQVGKTGKGVRYEKI